MLFSADGHRDTEISRKSVTSVLNNLNKDKYNISTIGITKNGAWYLYTGDYAKIESGEWEQDTENKRKAILSPDAEDKAILVFDGDKVTKIHPDVIFPVLHWRSPERTEQFKVFLNFREFLMSVWV